MSDIYDKFIDREPHCFGTFILVDAVNAQSDWAVSKEFLSKLIQCSCGNQKLHVLTSHNEKINLAPIILACPVCEKREEIFSPDKHGWDGQNGDNCAKIGSLEPQLINDTASRIVVEYSYQGIENYEDLIEDDIENPEDYFDVFNLFLMDEAGNLEEIVCYECA